MSDDDETAFLDIEGLGILSRAAFQLHTAAAINSVKDGHPGFVADEWLNAIPAQTTTTVAELEVAGIWARRPGGYFIVKDSAISTVIAFRERSDELARACQERGHHRPDDDDDSSSGWLVCEDCGVPLRRPDGGPVALPDGGQLGPDPRDGQSE